MHWNGDCKLCEREAVNSSGLCAKHLKESRAFWPPAVSCIEWMDALAQAWRALAALRKYNEAVNDSMLMIEVEHTMIRIKQRRPDVESASIEKLTDPTKLNRGNNQT